MPERRAETWTTVVATVAPIDAELAADHLWAAGPAAIEERDHGGRTVLLAGFDDPERAAQAAAAVDAAGFGPAAVRPVDDDGLDAWRAFATPMAAGPFWLVPAWLADDRGGGTTAGPAAPDGSTRLLVDPGRTFGSGSHPTTRLVLAALAPLAGPGTRVLDVGCGSGVLAVAAALCGATPVTAIDVDPASPATTRANAARNAVAEAVAASVEPLAAVVATGSRFDLVLANLLAPTVAELAADLVAAVAPGGAVVVSGLLADRWPATTGLLAPLVVEAVAEDEGWAAVVLRSPGGRHPS